MSYYKDLEIIKSKPKIKNTKVFEKAIPEDILNKFHEIVNNFLKKDLFILKGSRALNYTLKLYNDDDLKYVDYDFYSINPKECLLELANVLNENGIFQISVENIVFKPHIFRLYIYTIPFIDVEPISEELWNYLPIFIKNDTKIIQQKYQKIDMYVQVGRPTLLNISNWEKVIHRLVALNKLKKTEKDGIPSIRDKKDDISHLYGLIDSDAIITGEEAYNFHMNEIKDCYKPITNKIEIFTHRIDKYIDIFSKELGGDIIVKDCGNFMELVSKFYIIYQNDIPKVYIYYLDDCISYNSLETFKFSSQHHLLFYLYMFYYLPEAQENFEHRIVVSNMIYNLEENPKKIEINCFGHRNPGILGLRKMFINKDVLFRWKPISNSLEKPNENII